MAPAPPALQPPADPPAADRHVPAVLHRPGPLRPALAGPADQLLVVAGPGALAGGLGQLAADRVGGHYRVAGLVGVHTQRHRHRGSSCAGSAPRLGQRTRFSGGQGQAPDPKIPRPPGRWPRTEPVIRRVLGPVGQAASVGSTMTTWLLRITIRWPVRAWSCQARLRALRCLSIRDA